MNARSQPGPILLPRKLAFFFASACFLAALPAYSQQAQLDSLAGQTAQTLEKAHVKSVVVADFWNSNKQLSKLGKMMADQFSAALHIEGSKVQILGRDRLRNFLDKSGLSAAILDNSDVRLWVAKGVGAKAIVLGEVGREGDQFHVTVSIYKTSDGKNLGNFGVTLPGGPDWNNLIDNLDKEEDVHSAPEAGKNGYREASCSYCPTPTYTDAAFQHKAQGVVVLDVVITANGKATDIRVKQGMPYGLTVAAIREVQEWRFRPALGPDGKPAAMHTVLEVDFHIY